MTPDQDVCAWVHVGQRIQGDIEKLQAERQDALQRAATPVIENLLASLPIISARFSPVSRYNDEGYTDEIKIAATIQADGQTEAWHTWPKSWDDLISIAIGAMLAPEQVTDVYEIVDMTYSLRRANLTLTDVEAHRAKMDLLRNQLPSEIWAELDKYLGDGTLRPVVEDRKIVRWETGAWTYEEE